MNYQPKKSHPGFITKGLATAAVVAMCTAASTAYSAVFSPQFTVFGDVAAPKTFDYASLSAITPSVTKTVTFQAGPSTVTTTYTGVNLWHLLNDVVGLKLDSSIKNDVLRKFVVATGSDGYEASFSLGEIDPIFGNQPDFIAYNQNDVPITTDGFARVVVPGDSRGGRYVSNIVSLWVGDVGTVPSPPHVVPEPASLALLSMGLVALLGRFVTHRTRRLS
jgi:hypothetical protein